jgi:hypothetical protein
VLLYVDEKGPITAKTHGGTSWSSTQVKVEKDNLSIHKSKKAKDEISKYCPRIKFVFLPVRSPKLNLIEVRWSWLQRQTINNSTFKDEQEIGKAVSKWKDNYNQNHGKANTNILQENVSLCLHNC